METIIQRASVGLDFLLIDTAAGISDNVIELLLMAERIVCVTSFEPTAVVRHVGNASGAAAYGRRRTGTYLHNTYRFYRRHHGPVSTTTFRLLNLAGCARLYIQRRLQHDRAEAAFWADHVRAHLQLAGPTDSTSRQMLSASSGSLSSR